MAGTKFFRMLLIAMVVPAQASASTTVGIAQSAPAQCPAHTAAAPLEAHDPADHESHAIAAVPADHEHGIQPDPEHGGPQSPIFVFACCAAHLVGFIAPAQPSFSRTWIALTMIAGRPVLLPVDLSSVDPPPRIVL
jgi:hypothetical protein